MGIGPSSDGYLDLLVDSSPVSLINFGTQARQKRNTCTHYQDINLAPVHMSESGMHSTHS